MITENLNKFVLCPSSSGYVYSIKEVLANSHVSTLLLDTNFGLLALVDVHLCFSCAINTI